MIYPPHQMLTLEVTRRHAVRIEAKNGGLLAVELTEMLGRHIQ